MFGFIYKWFYSFFDYKNVKGLSIYNYDYDEFNLVIKYHAYKTSVLLILLIIVILIVARKNIFRKSYIKR